MHSRPFCTTISVYLLGSLDVSLSTLRTAHTGTLRVCEVRFDVLWNDVGTFQSEQKVLMCWRRSSRCSSFPWNDPLPRQCRRGLWKHPRGTPLQYANKHPNTVIIALHFLLTTTASLLMCSVMQWHRLCRDGDTGERFIDIGTLLGELAPRCTTQRFPALLHRNTV